MPIDHWHNVRINGVQASHHFNGLVFDQMAEQRYGFEIWSLLEVEDRILLKERKP
jgi:hypothetical protein